MPNGGTAICEGRTGTWEDKAVIHISYISHARLSCRDADTVGRPQCRTKSLAVVFGNFFVECPWLRWHAICTTAAIAHKKMNNRSKNRRLDCSPSGCPGGWQQNQPISPLVGFGLHVSQGVAVPGVAEHLYDANTVA